MTVCVSIKVHDCLVFAADSASSLTGVDGAGDPKVFNVWQHGNKVFNLFKGKPVAAMTCGMGHIGPASIGNLAKDFRFGLMKGDDDTRIDPDNYTIKNIVDRAHAFFAAKYAATGIPAPAKNYLEFWIGGYGSGCDHAELWKLILLDGVMQEPTLIAGTGEDGHIAWGGQPKAINRLIVGFDPDMRAALVDAGLPDATADPLLGQVREQLQTPLVHAAMPAQDAIYLADFLVDVTKRYFAFLPGADVVGGDTDIATVTKHEGFKWIRRKHYYSSDLNPRSTDHV